MDLILHTYGASISCDNSAFVVTTADRQRQRLAPQGIDTIQIGRGVHVSSDALLMAIDHEIEVLLIDRGGTPQGRLWSARYGSVSTIRKGQLQFALSPQAVEWIKQVIAQKVFHQQALLLSLHTEHAQQRLIIDRAVSRLEEYLLKIQALTADHVRDIAPTLRAWEGAAAKIYFETLMPFLPEEHRFEKRTQHPALDPANALFNYAYGILYGKIEGALIKAGIDPYIGILHRDEHRRPVLVYDVIEAFRIWADYVVISILSQRVLTDAYYSRRSDGSYWLEALGRRVLIQSMNDYLDEVVLMEGLNRSRATHLQLYAQRLAQLFKTLQEQQNR